MASPTAAFNLHQHYTKHLARAWRRAPFVLRLTTWKDLPVPVLVIKERQRVNGATPHQPLAAEVSNRAERGSLTERGHLAGEAQRRCLPVVRQIVGHVRDDSGIPLEVQRYLTREGLKLRLNLPLDEEAGAKLGLLFRLQERLTDLDRVELIARRVARFTREEAVYWLSRMTSYGSDANRWAVSGLRLVLGGQAGDPAVGRMLERLRQTR